MRNFHNIERRPSTTTFFSGARYIGYGREDNFYITRAANGRKSEGWYAYGFRKGTMRQTHLLRARTLAEMSKHIETF